MIGYLTRKEELKTSKRVYIKGTDGEEIKYLLNTENFDDIKVNSPVKFEVSGDWRGIPIITKLTFNFETPEEMMESEMFEKMYGPKSVPKLKEIMEEMISFVNTTNDQSNIGGGPRNINFDDLKTAICNYLTDKIIEEDEEGNPKIVEYNRLSSFLECPASTHHHDAQKGGLLRHIAKMIGICENMFKARFQEYESHPLVLMIGILVHDIGKIDQYTKDENGEYKYADNSFYKGNHIGIGLERWARNGRQFLLDIRLRPRDVENMYWDIWHMIGSHHGAIENRMGSAWSPFGHDAWTLHIIDFLESRQEEGIKPVRTE